MSLCWFCKGFFILVVLFNAGPTAGVSEGDISQVPPSLLRQLKNACRDAVTLRHGDTVDEERLQKRVTEVVGLALAASKHVGRRKKITRYAFGSYLLPASFVVESWKCKVGSCQSLIGWRDLSRCDAAGVRHRALPKSMALGS